MRAAALGLALALGGCASSGPTGLPATHAIALHPYAGKLRYLEATSPAGARLLFDTGGGLTLLSPATAQRVGCVPYTRLTALRMNGDRFDVDACGPVPLQLGSLHVRAEAGVFDLMALLPAGLPQLDGVASLQTFAGHVVTLDLAHDRLEIADAVDAQKLVGPSALGIRHSRSFAGAGLDLLVRVRGSRGPLWFELDSGNLDAVLVSPRVLDQLGFSAAAVQALRDGATRDVPLPIDGLGEVVVAARASDLIYDGALNAALLERLELVLDLERSLAWGRLRD